MNSLAVEVVSDTEALVIYSVSNVTVLSARCAPSMTRTSTFMIPLKFNIYLFLE